MTLPGISLRRVFLIARRDYLGYVKTWGFWISFFLPFVFGLIGFFAAQADFSVQPIRYETILDETGIHGKAIIERRDSKRRNLEIETVQRIGELVLSDAEAKKQREIIKAEGLQAGRDYMNEKAPGAGERAFLPDRKTVLIDPPEDTLEALMPYILNEKQVIYNGEPVRLSGVLNIKNTADVAVEYWTTNINSTSMEAITNEYFRHISAEKYLQTGGLTSEGFIRARESKVGLEVLDPTKSVKGGARQTVTLTDHIPYIVAGALSVALWFTIFAGSYMLLTSMLEEKLNKLLEMMLASVRFSEVMFGKLLGAAALTITAMLPYIVISIVVVIGLILTGDDEVRAGLMEAFSAKLIIFFIIYLVLGYVFYGAFFIGLGALAESTQDAQTLTTPIMLILTICVMVVPIGMTSPESPIIEFASWFPLSAPFAAIIKLASDPPVWELALSAFFLFLCVVGVVWLANQLFRYGVLSGSGVKAGFGNLKNWIAESRAKRKLSKKMTQ